MVVEQNHTLYTGPVCPHTTFPEEKKLTFTQKAPEDKYVVFYDYG